MKKRKREKPGVSLAAAVFLFIGLLLCVIQLKAENPLIIAERFLKGGGWIEIPLIALVSVFRRAVSKIPRGQVVGQ